VWRSPRARLAKDAKRGPGIAALLVLALVLAPMTTGCRAGYVARLAVEEARYLASAEPAVRLLERAEDPARREALEALLAVREFAQREGLSVGGSYRKVADTGAAAPFHVVTAAWPDRLEAYTWWYPVIGAIPYRGHFSRPPAERDAAALVARGLDTRIVEASGYSTLGWFNDPLPSSVLAGGRWAVVITVLHELVHQTFFAPGQVAFNETLATAVAWRLAERFHSERGELDEAARMQRARLAWVERGRVLDAAAARLRAFFDVARAEDWPRQRLMEERASLYREILAEAVEADPRFAVEFGAADLDNASFLAVHRYATRAPEIDAFIGAMPTTALAFERLREMAASGGDLFERVAKSIAASGCSAPGPC
jgi:predicted aminopeptidase